MMKKRQSLQLKRETVRILTDPELRIAAGGGPIPKWMRDRSELTCFGSCEWSVDNCDPPPVTVATIVPR